MGVYSFDALKAHVGHKIVCVEYKGEDATQVDNVAVECEDCNEVLIDYDSDEDDEEEGLI